jgi:hypothetical protein
MSLMSAIRVDLAERARQAENNYCRLLDPQLNWIPWFYAHLNREESRADHCEWCFGDATGRYLDALVLCTRMTGLSDETVLGTARLRKALLDMYSEGDGLCYRPAGFDFVKFGANMFDQRSALLGLVSLLQDTGDEEILDRIRAQVRGLRRIARDRGSYCFFPYIDYTPGAERTAPQELSELSGIDLLHYGGGVLIHPLMRFVETTGDEATLDLAAKLVDFVVRRSGVYDEDGAFYSKGGTDCAGHVHSRLDVLGGVLRFARYTKDRELLAWCGRVYDWSRSLGSTYGWYPEGVDTRETRRTLPHSEICCTTDVIHAAIHLARSGRAECWDHAEQYLNQLLATQVLDTSWAASVRKERTIQSDYEDIPARYRGGFPGRTRPNDLTNNGFFDTMGCCCAAGGRGLYQIWHHAVDLEDDAATVNLWVDRSLPELDVTVRLGAEGRLTLSPKRRMTLRVRAPHWLDTSSARAEVNGAQSPLPHADGYLHFEDVPENGVVELIFDAPVVVREEAIAGNPYAVSWRGNVVVGIEPPGPHMPLWASR